MIKKVTNTYRYTVDDSFVLRLWHKEVSEDAPPFLEQPFNPETGETFASVADAEKYFTDYYGEVAIEE